MGVVTLDTVMKVEGTSVCSRFRGDTLMKGDIRGELDLSRRGVRGLGGTN